MAKIDTWLNNQLPDIKRNLTVEKGLDFLHISTNATIKKMRPRIGDRQMKEEDRTIPRICGCETLVGCIYGHSGIHRQTMDAAFGEFEWDGIITVYKLEIDNFVRPNDKLVPDAGRTKELWIVPYSPEAYEVKTRKVGRMVVAHATEEADAGEVVQKNLFYLEVGEPFKVEDEVFDIGLYSFRLDGGLFLTSDKKSKPESIYDIRTITPGLWNETIAKMKKIHAMRKSA